MHKHLLNLKKTKNVLFTEILIRVTVIMIRLRQNSLESDGSRFPKLHHTTIQCCGAGAGGAEIIWDLEPEPKLSF